jgi:hypothetical protein
MAISPPKRALVVALVAAAALVPAAAASSQKNHPRHVRLSLVPLQTAQLGPLGTSLPIQFGSGTVSNADASTGLKKLGRVVGYQLDYGNLYSGGAGVTSIVTEVEQYRTPADAKKGLEFGKKSEKLVAALYHKIGITTGAHFFKVRAVGSGSFAYVSSMKIPNADPLYTVDEETRSGSFVLHAFVAAGTESSAEHLAPVLMPKLVHRMRQLIDGHLHGTPAKLPPIPPAGPPSSGPDLSTLAVGPSDFTGTSTVANQGYGTDPTTVSSYEIDLRPAGPFQEVQQIIRWYANDNEATWEGTLFATIFSGNALTPVDLGSAGDNAQAVIGKGEDDSGNPLFIAIVAMWRGQAVDIAIAVNPTTIQPSAVQTLAQAMANRLNAGLAG